MYVDYFTYIAIIFEDIIGIIVQKSSIFFYFLNGPNLNVFSIRIWTVLILVFLLYRYII